MKTRSSLLAMLGLVLAIWIVVGLGPLFVFSKTDIAAQFGDAFGAANSLFSALALFFVIFTILRQDAESASRDKQHTEMLQLQALSTLAQVQMTKWTEAADAVDKNGTRFSVINEIRRRAAEEQLDKLEATAKQLEEILKRTGIEIPERAQKMK